MIKLNLVPDADGYGSTDGAEVIRSELEGGAGRYRRDKVGASKMVSARWTLNREQYQYWRAFYRAATLNGALPFLCNLMSEDGNGPTEQVCNFMPGSASLQSQLGFTYVMQAQLEVRPLKIDPLLDAQVLFLYGEYGEAANPLLSYLGRLTTVTMPGNIGA